MDRDALLMRYGVLAANRRHFENLFFAVTAFTWIFSLALWTALVSLRPANSHVALASAGTILIGGAFIAHRLMLRERSSFDAMAASWRTISGEPRKTETNPRWLGAMVIASAGMAITGIVCVMAGVLRL